MGTEISEGTQFLKVQSLLQLSQRVNLQLGGGVDLRFVERLVMAPVPRFKYPQTSSCQELDILMMKDFSSRGDIETHAKFLLCNSFAPLKCNFILIQLWDFPPMINYSPPPPFCSLIIYLPKVRLLPDLICSSLFHRPLFISFTILLFIFLKKTLPKGQRNESLLNYTTTIFCQ